MEPEWTLDPEDPRAPSEAQWSQMSPYQRSRVASSLPSEFPLASPPEGDRHRLPATRALEALDSYFRRKGRSVYLSAGLPIYYPGERMFAPDLIAVLDVGTNPRDRWLVSEEGKGLDFALEITLFGSAEKDLTRNVERYARLGIPEYFVFDVRERRIDGFTLAEGARRYDRIVPQHGRWASGVLGLELAIEFERIRFFSGSASLPEAQELADRLEALADKAMETAGFATSRLLAEEARAEVERERAEAEAQRAEAEAQRAEAEAQRAERLAAKLRELGVDPDDL